MLWPRCLQHTVRIRHTQISKRLSPIAHSRSCHAATLLTLQRHICRDWIKHLAKKGNASCTLLLQPGCLQHAVAVCHPAILEAACVRAAITVKPWKQHGSQESSSACTYGTNAVLQLLVNLIT